MSESTPIASRCNPAPCINPHQRPNLAIGLCRPCQQPHTPQRIFLHLVSSPDTSPFTQPAATSPSGAYSFPAASAALDVHIANRGPCVLPRRASCGTAPPKPACFVPAPCPKSLGKVSFKLQITYGRRCGQRGKSACDSTLGTVAKRPGFNDFPVVRNRHNAALGDPTWGIFMRRKISAALRCIRAMPKGVLSCSPKQS